MIRNFISRLKDLYKRSEVSWEAVKYKGSKSYCYYDGRKLVGYCQVLGDYTICNLVVDKEYRGQGIASELLQRATGEGAKYLGCLKPSVGFYARRGFRVYCVEYSQEFGADLYYMKIIEKSI